MGSLASFTSTLSTLIPHGSVASSSRDCIELETEWRSLRISWRYLVPNTLVRVVCESSEVEWWAFSTFVLDIVALETR